MNNIGTIIIRRNPHRANLGKLSKYDVLIDGKKVGAIEGGEERSFEVFAR